jgi:HlyD family secretion protein
MKEAVRIILGVTLGAAAMWVAQNRLQGHMSPAVESVAHANAVSPSPAVVAAAQGRVEGNTESVPVAAAIDGVIHEVRVKEGQHVQAGEILAEIGCEDLTAQIRSLEAVVESLRQVRVRVLRGSRDEERRAAERETQAAQALADEAEKRSHRMEILAKDVVARADADAAERDHRNTLASLEAAKEREKLAKAGPLPEEVAKANADVIDAEHRLQSTIAQKEKCSIKAPISGTVLRVHLKAGEAFSTIMPMPIFTIADVSRFRVRAEIDERDLGSVRLGQKAAIHAEGFPDSPIIGEITWLAATMGRKTALSSNPAEKTDRDIREALIDFDPGDRTLVVGLRVTVEFLK